MALLARDLIEQGLSWRYTPRRILQLMSTPETACVVACNRDDVQGFAVMQFGDAHAHLVLLAVRPELQRQGVGASLLGWLMASARVAGMASVRLELREDNAQAMAFYRRQGFEQTVLLPGYYEGRVDARRMLKVIRAATLP